MATRVSASLISRTIQPTTISLMLWDLLISDSIAEPLW